MHAPRKRTRRLLAVTAGILALMATSFSAVGSAAEEEGFKNLSVPAIYIGSGGPGPSTCGPHVLPAGETTYFAAPPSPAVAGDYYVQGEDTWQAECTIAAPGLLVSTKWGDNLTGAPLKTGTPIRLELGLLADTTVYSMTGFEVYKLTDELDRLATYGTLGTPVTNPFGEVRVWAAGATYSVQNLDTGTYAVPPGTAFGAEVNSTGRIVYGAQLQTTAPGTYRITFESANVTFDADGSHTASLDFEVSTSAGGGGKGGGGGRPDNPGGGKGGGNGGGGGPKGPGPR